MKTTKQDTKTNTEKSASSKSTTKSTTTDIAKKSKNKLQKTSSSFSQKFVPARKKNTQRLPKHLKISSRQKNFHRHHRHHHHHHHLANLCHRKR